MSKSKLFKRKVERTKKCKTLKVPVHIYNVIKTDLSEQLANLTPPWPQREA
jgi:hypothetical protein